ncbi:MAG: ADOP family duplicated permease [Vicinamibacterales bacterium]
MIGRAAIVAEALRQDVRDAVRALARRPAFTLASVATLAVGLGLNAAVFTVADAVLTRGFRGVAANDRLLYIGTQRDGRGCCVSYPDLRDWRERLTSFEGLAAVADRRITLVDARGVAETSTATRVTANTFALLGTAPVAGRDFTATDEQPGAPAVAILSHRLWTRRYAADPAIVGATVRVNDVPTTIVGVMPAGLAFPQRQDLWVPLVPSPDEQRRDARGLWFAVGRLRPGVTFRQAEAELAAVGRGLGTAYPATNEGWVPAPLDFAAFFVSRDAARLYRALWAAVGLVLLIACANLANLALSHAVDRAHDLAVRRALGASRRRLALQRVVEHGILSAAGALGGWAIAAAVVQVYAAAAQPPAQRWSVGLLDLGLNGRVFAYLTAAAVLTTLLVGAVPALGGLGVDLRRVLGDGGPRASWGRSRSRLSAGLVVGQIALAVVLLAGAGMMARTFVAMARTSIGVDASRTLALLIRLPDEDYPTAASQAGFFDRLRRELSAAPGIEAAGLASATPLAPAAARSYEAADGDGRAGAAATVPVLVVDDGYFAALGVAPVAGRAFGPQDDHGDETVIVNRRFAEREWQGRDPIGRRLRFFDGGQAGPWRTVVGIAPDIAQDDAARSRREAGPVAYVPLARSPAPSMWVLVRTEGTAAAIATVRQGVEAVDRGLPIWIGPMVLSDWLASMGQYWRTGTSSVLVTTFAAIALLLASLGLHASLAHAVGRRRREMGIRLAVGGSPGGILGLVYRQGMALVLTGLAIGLAATAGLGRLLRGTLAPSASMDVTTGVLAAAILLVAATIACVVPARRAMRVDPAETLREA